jgi:two-component system, cell cycle sensor histidine kinase and response regulator CckA
MDADNSPVMSSPQTISQATILVVDDEEPIRLLMATTLRKVGYRVIQAEDGEDALRQWTGRAQEIDMVITDVVMPRLTGLELIPQLLTLSPNLPILMISGYPREDASPTVASGGVEFLPKPFRLDELLKNVRSLLARKAALQGQS